MAGDIPSLAQQLGAAVELTMNPSVPMEQRHQVIPNTHALFFNDSF